jgi:signal transduction histidine kinase
MTPIDYISVSILFLLLIIATIKLSLDLRKGGKRENIKEKRLAEAIIDAQERERLFIGQELHDNVNQILACAQITLSAARDYYPDLVKVNELINTARTRIDESINEIRKLSHQLAPSVLDGLLLKDVFQDLLYTINVRHQYKIHLEFDERLNNLKDENIMMNLYRIMQEQTKNITKYAEAEQIKVILRLCGRNIFFMIQDNGRGFDMNTVKKGIGLNNIRKRAESMSGKFSLKAAPGKGCTLIIEIPV